MWEDNERYWNMIRGAGFLCEMRKKGVSCLRMVEGAVMVVKGGSRRSERVRRGVWDAAGMNMKRSTGRRRLTRVRGYCRAQRGLIC